MDAGSLSLGTSLVLCVGDVIFIFFVNGEGTVIFNRFGVVLLINETRDYLWGVKSGRKVGGKKENNLKFQLEMQTLTIFGKTFSLAAKYLRNCKHAQKRNHSLSSLSC